MFLLYYIVLLFINVVVSLIEYFTTEAPASAKCYGAAGAVTENFSFFCPSASGSESLRLGEETTMGKKNTALRGRKKNKR